MRWLILVAGLAITAGCALAGCGSGPAAPPVSGATAEPAFSAGPPFSAGPTAGSLATSCTLGSLGGDTFYPNTGPSPGPEDGDTSPGSGFKATFTDHGTQGEELTTYTITITYQGSAVNSQTVTLTTPYFIAPGETYTDEVPFSSLSNDVDVATGTYLDSLCSVTPGE